MFLHIFVFYLQFAVQEAQERKVVVGLLMTKDSPDISDLVGYQRSASAVMIAMDRIENENLLPNINITFKWYFDECETYLSSGYLTRLIQDNVNVILGPVCPASAMAAGVLAHFYEFPIYIWGTVMPAQLLDNSIYPTVVTTVPSSIPLSQSFITMMHNFRWGEFAFVYSLNRSSKAPRCSYIQQDIENAVNYDPNVTITFKRQMSVINNETMFDILNRIKTRARIVAACLETDDQRREFMKGVLNAGMNTNDYVYIFLETRKQGFGNPPFWVDQSAQSDGLDEQIKTACKELLILDNQVLNETVTTFNDEVIARMKDYPFYCTTECKGYTTAAIQAPFLADAMYLYARALNKTLSENPEADIKNGTELVTNSQGSFEGYSGRMVIDKDGNRNAIYNLYGLNTNEEPEKWVIIGMIENVTKWAPLYTNAATSIWATRGGVQPVAVPECGFTGTECPPSFMESYFVYVLVACILLFVFAIIAIATIVYVIKARKKEQLRLDQLWQINFASLVKANEKASISKSAYSIQSGTSSTSTRIMTEPLAETDTHAFYYLFNDAVVARKHIARPRIEKQHAVELRLMCKLDKENLNKFMGLCTNGPQYLSVWKFCGRGSLKNIIEKGTLTMDAFFIYSLMKDICEGIYALHHSAFGCHGHLTSSSCLVDDRWQVKLSNFGLSFLKEAEPRPVNTLLWTAPELLREENNVGTKKGDIYSFAIICSEIITRKSAFNIDEREESVEELVYKIKRVEGSPFRPVIATNDIQDMSPTTLHLIRDCWSESPEARPTIDIVKNILKSMQRGGNLMDHVFTMLEQYATNLEEEVEARTKELVEEKKKSDILLYRMLPKEVAEKLKLGLTVQPESFESVTVFFSDVVKFTNLASKCTPLQVVNLLNDLYTTFDTIIDEHQVYKVETIGDGYLCVSGLPDRNGNEHARNVAEMSFAFLKSLISFRVPHLPAERINIRIGMHTGPVVAGVVGLTMPRYCLFGDTVNTASRMESNGKPGHIHISAETNKFLTKIIGGYSTESRGEVIIKGKGVMETFWLLPDDHFTMGSDSPL